MLLFYFKRRGESPSAGGCAGRWRRGAGLGQRHCDLNEAAWWCQLLGVGDRVDGATKNAGLVSEWPLRAPQRDGHSPSRDTAGWEIPGLPHPACTVSHKPIPPDDLWATTRVRASRFHSGQYGEDEDLAPSGSPTVWSAKGYAPTLAHTNAAEMRRLRVCGQSSGRRGCALRSGHTGEGTRALNQPIVWASHAMTRGKDVCSARMNFPWEEQATIGMDGAHELPDYRFETSAQRTSRTTLIPAGVDPSEPAPAVARSAGGRLRWGECGRVPAAVWRRSSRPDR